MHLRDIETQPDGGHADDRQRRHTHTKKQDATNSILYSTEFRSICK